MINVLSRGSWHLLRYVWKYWTPEFHRQMSLVCNPNKDVRAVSGKMESDTCLHIILFSFTQKPCEYCPPLLSVLWINQYCNARHTNTLAGEFGSRYHIPIKDSNVTYSFGDNIEVIEMSCRHRWE